MTRIRSAAAILTLAIGSIGSAASADHLCANISQSPQNSRRCEVAASQSGAMIVIWEEDDGWIWSRSRYPDGAWMSAFRIGPGIDPAVACGSGGFTIAYSSGGSIVTRSGFGAGWSEPVVLGPSGSAHPHLWATESAYGLDALLAWEEPGGTAWFAYRFNGAWSAPEVAATAANPYEPLCPKAVLTSAQGGSVRVFYFDQLTLKYCDQIHPGWWTDPATVDPDWAFGAEFDVSVDSSRRARIVSLLTPPL